MSEKRLNQVNQLILKEVAELLLKEVEFPLGCLVTVIKVKTSADIAHAKVYISVLPVSQTGTVLKILAKNVYHLQQCLNRRMFRRIVPKIIFTVDSTEEEAARVEALIDKISEES
ncbi:MAG: 30S ribosome-binding factor RbfA [Patescibacteria group bacterium]